MCFLRLCVCIYALISLTAASAFLFGDCAHSVLFSSSLISSLFSSHLNMACDSLASLFLSYLCSLFSSFFSSLSSPSQSAGVSVDLLLSSVLLLTPEKPRDQRSYVNYFTAEHQANNPPFIYNNNTLQQQQLFKKHIEEQSEN